MYPQRFYPGRMFAARYFAKVGADVTFTDPGARRVHRLGPRRLHTVSRAEHVLPARRRHGVEG